MSIDNEELSSLLTTIRNQEREIETLNKEAESMRKNIEQYNIEHRLREEPKEKAPKAKETKVRKTTTRKTAKKADKKA